MATIFPREEKAEALFGEILKNPEACHRLIDTFNDSLDMAEVLDAPAVSAQQFAAALFNAYENKDLSAFLMAICQHSMFDLLRNAALIPFKFNADGQPNPVILTDDAGVLLPNNKFAVSSKVYDRFIRVFQKQEKVKMYLASGYCKYHGYDEGSMDVVEYHYNQHLGLLLIYELPDTVKQKVTEAEAYSTVWDIQMKLQHALPRSVVYYGQDTLKDGGTRYDELGVFLPLEHFADRLERHVETATKIVYGEETPCKRTPFISALQQNKTQRTVKRFAAFCLIRENGNAAHQVQ